VSSSRVIVGVDAAIADAASLALMVESVGQGTDQWKDAIKRYSNIQIAYSYQLLSYSITLKVRSEEKIEPFRKISTQLLRVFLKCFSTIASQGAEL
jgi:2-polyprenyl-6-methoxyphenol hydroxylase-like FAD-dependent oxidoreductase